MGKITKEEVEAFARDFPHFWQWAWEERRWFHEKCKDTDSGVSQEESNAFEFEFATVVARCFYKSRRDGELEEVYRAERERVGDE
jgi:hypothetical protein